MNRGMNRAVFLDRDGVVNVEKNYVCKIEDFEFMPGIFDLCRKYRDEGYLLIIITNQAGIARGFYTEEQFLSLTDWMMEKFNEQGITITKVYFCPHHPDFTGECECRKPNPGMILQAAKEFDIDLTQSILIGDKESDMEAGKRAGVRVNMNIKNTIMATKNDIANLVKQYYIENHSERRFVPGETMIPFAGRVFDEKEMINLVDASLDFWLTTGRYAEEFEKKFASFMQQKYCMLVNSGSSANLIAVAALTSELLKEKQLKPEDEILTVAAGFPTTVNPIVQNGLIPVFVDVELDTFNIKVSEIENAVSEKTKAIILAHTLGNPFNLDAVKEICDKYNLFLIEDCCDAVGSTYREKQVGTFGDFATASFYPAHHITMGEGGSVLTNNPLLHRIAASLRDWGRDCFCEPGHDNTCGLRFKKQYGDLPEGYDHKYVYSHIGYNLKVTDMQAAIGVAQLSKLPDFIEKRKHNFNILRKELEQYNEYLILPEATPNSDPAWFGFPFNVRENNKFSRKDLAEYLESHKILTRQLFAGNIIKQPAYKNVKYRISGKLENTDYIMHNTIFIGVYPGIDEVRMNYIMAVFSNFFNNLHA